MSNISSTCSNPDGSRRLDRSNRSSCLPMNPCGRPLPRITRGSLTASRVSSDEDELSELSGLLSEETFSA